MDGLWYYLFILGVLAKLGSRCVRIAEARGSNPLHSTIETSKALLIQGFCSLFNTFGGCRLWRIVPDCAAIFGEERLSEGN